LIVNGIGKNHKQEAPKGIECVVPDLARVHLARAQQYIGNYVGGSPCPSDNIQQEGSHVHKH